MSPFEELWSGSAEADLGRFPDAAQEQIRVLVRRLCDDPYADNTHEVPTLRRTRIRQAGLLAVFYQVDELDRLVYITRVVWRG